MTNETQKLYKIMFWAPAVIVVI